MRFCTITAGGEIALKFETIESFIKLMHFNQNLKVKLNFWFNKKWIHILSARETISKHFRRGFIKFLIQQTPLGYAVDVQSKSATEGILSIPGIDLAKGVCCTEFFLIIYKKKNKYVFCRL